MDKQDELAAIICVARIGVELPEGAAVEPGEVDLRIAAAVRSFMASEEAVDRVAAAIVMKADGCDWENMTERARDCERDVARAALSATIGEDIGGRRG